MRSCLDAVFEITKLIKKSPQRDAIFQKLKHDLATDTPSFRVLCPTRWTVRAASLQSVLDNYEVLLSVWEESKNSQIDSEVNPLTADSINQGINFIAMLKIMFSMHAVGVLMTQS